MNNLPLSPDVISFANFNTGTTAKNTSAKLVPWPSRFAIFFFRFYKALESTVETTAIN